VGQEVKSADGGTTDQSEGLPKIEVSPSVTIGAEDRKPLRSQITQKLKNEIKIISAPNTEHHDVRTGRVEMSRRGH